MNPFLRRGLMPPLALPGTSNNEKDCIGLLALACAFSAQAAERIVVAGGSLTELIYAIGAGNRVVGVDETTSYPPQTQALPHIGYWKQLSSEGILSLRPDSFITWQDAGPQLVFDQLRAQKVNVVTLPRVPSPPVCQVPIPGALSVAKSFMTVKNRSRRSGTPALNWVRFRSFTVLIYSCLLVISAVPVS